MCKPLKIKRLFFLLVSVFFIVFSALEGHCDEIILKDGTKLAGNIINIDKINGELVFAIVEDDELTGSTLTFKKDEMIYINKDDKYKDLVRKEISEDERQKQNLKVIKRINVNARNIDSRIRQRVSREIYNVRRAEDLEEYKKETEKERQKELDVEVIKATAEILKKPDVVIIAP